MMSSKIAKMVLGANGEARIAPDFHTATLQESHLTASCAS